MRRLTLAQYRNTVTDLLGPGLKIPSLEEEPKTGGFSTTGAMQVATSFHGVEQYVEAADSLARQVFGDPERKKTLTSRPGFVASFGAAAFRRPLTREERRRYEAMDPRVAVTAMLASPAFIYVTERGDPKPDAHGRYRLTSYEIATRLSLFLWNTTPDAELLAAAARNELAGDQGDRNVRKHALRLLVSPRARQGMRDFFDESFRLADAAAILRPKQKFPDFNYRWGKAMREETLRVLERNLFDSRTDFRDLYVTRDTFVNGDLATLYGVDMPKDADFRMVTLPAGPRRGLLGQGAFLAGTSGVDKTSPTARGKYVREVVLCEDVPAPPPEVDTNLPPSPKGENLTVRERLEDHRQDVGCSKCHKFIDTIGLAFERFDLNGGYRETELDKPIDPSGELDGRTFEDPAALGQILAQDERVPRCMVRNLYRYATGRSGEDESEPTVNALAAAFKASGYRLYDAVVALTTSEGFLHVD